MTSKGERIYIHSLEPIWIEYGIFACLPKEGEDIFCDSVTFHFGQGYEFVSVLQKAGFTTRWFLHYSEPAFKALVLQQAVRDGIQDCIFPTVQTCKTSLAVSAPLQSTDTKYLLVNPPKEINTDQLMADVLENCWLILWGWLPDSDLHKVLAYCLRLGIRVCLGVPLHERYPFSLTALLDAITYFPVFETICFYTPAYLPESKTALTPNLLDECRAKVPVVIFEDENGIHFYCLSNELNYQVENIVGSNTLNRWFGSYFQTRLSGSTSHVAFIYAQSKLNTSCQ